MNGKLLLVILLVFLLPAASRCSAAPEAFEAREFQTPFGETLKYRIHLPAEFKAGEHYPLLLFFHGSGQRGEDNNKQLTVGVGDILAYTKKYRQPVIIVAPQCPPAMQWVNTPWRAPSHEMPEYPSCPLKLTMELLDTLLQELPVDRQRLYVTGLSMGGFATWDLLQRKPQLFAAAVPVCGGGDTRLAEKIKDVPLWVFHGARDQVVSVQRSRAMIQALKEAGSSPRYTEYPEADHDSWSATYTNEEVFRWLFSQKNGDFKVKSD